jgi:hypothetical protein
VNEHGGVECSRLLADHPVTTPGRVDQRDQRPWRARRPTRGLPAW